MRFFLGFVMALITGIWFDTQQTLPHVGYALFCITFILLFGGLISFCRSIK